MISSLVLLALGICPANSHAQEGIQLADHHQLGLYWELDTSRMGPKKPTGLLALLLQHRSMRVRMRYTINAEGEPENIQLLDATPKVLLRPEHARVVIEEFAFDRFRPGKHNPDALPVRFEGWIPIRMIQ